MGTPSRERTAATAISGSPGIIGAPGSSARSRAIASTCVAKNAPPAKRSGSSAMKNAPSRRGASSAPNIDGMCLP